MGELKTKIRDLILNIIYNVNTSMFCYIILRRSRKFYWPMVGGMITSGPLSDLKATERL